MLNLLPSLAVSLVLTLLLEGLFARIWGVKGVRDWEIIVLVNVVTNPIVVTLHHCVSSGVAFTALLEVSAVIAEWLAYRKWGKTTKPAFLFSLCANCFSYFSGVLINILVGLWMGGF